MAGKIINTKGEVIGKTDALEPFTIGQRRGVRIGGAGPYYVVDKDLKKRELLVTKNPRDSLLYKKELFTDKIHWISGQEPKLPLDIRARVRYRQKLQSAKIKKSGKRYKVVFKKPERAITSGQSLVIYKGEECLGGGVIE